MKIKNCDCEAIHTELTDKIKKEMPKEQVLNKISVFFKIMGDNTRIKLLCALDKNRLCVCDLAYILNMTKSAISHQLKVLREANLVICEKQGKHVYYTLSDGHVETIFEKALEHICE